MFYRIRRYEEGQATELGTHELSESPTTPQIVDCVTAIDATAMGMDAKDLHPGYDPQDANLIETVDGWLLIASTIEGCASLIHVQS